MTMPLAFVLATILTRPAHHGSTGHYDRTRPVYLSGTVVTADWGYPHATMTVDVPEGLRVPADAGRFATLDELNDRPIVDSLSARPPGRVEILFPPDIMADVVPSDDRPERGDRAEAVVFRRCDQGNSWDGELRVQAVATPSGRVVFRSAGTRTRYSDGCPGGSSAPSASGAGAPTSRDDNGDALLGGAVVAGVGVGAAAAVAWITRRRRHVAGR